jgi:hypothetical protein
MNPELRLEHRLQSLENKELAKEILDTLQWYRLSLQHSKKENDILKKRLSDISWANDTQMGRY